jgi:hypothetical protein
MSIDPNLEATFLSALKKQFKKPGPWKIEHRSATEWYEIPDGQIHEIYVFVDSAQYLYFQTSTLKARNFSWLSPIIANPSQVGDPGMVIDWENLITGDQFYPITAIIPNHLWAATEGWKFSEGEAIRAQTTDYWIRWRRRFDLE